jgi:serine/threonine protein kinase
MMAVDRWNLIEEIFHGALERPFAERQRYVLNACGDDPELRLEVESLLANDREAASTLGSLVVSDLRTVIIEPAAVATGTRLGPYKLVRDLDSGGMGIVYLAVRSDDQYFQIVAIKMIRKGMESPALLQRFRTERQVLATLSHPNIGTILDGGETADGRPFIVMEFVEGQPITQACVNLDLSIRRRIELFHSLCSAVHYAHQKLVIHRDIKPSNVLVTPDSVVKLIDFGISKPISPGFIPGESTSMATTGLILTPDYASPEQLSGLELTTSTDIYSLGVLLYELLTGSRPYTLSGLSYAAALKLVCSGEIRQPSATPKLSDKFRKELAGDLDRIILMAMEKDPSRRYQSAQHLNEDLLRYLEGKPVLARKATPLYRLGKFVQRHRTASMMGCVTVAIIVGSILFYSWQSRRTERRVKQVETLANAAITDITEKLQESPVSTAAQAILLHSALNSLDQLRQSSGNEPRALLALAKAYGRIGDVQGSPASAANLGDPVAAVASYQSALRAALEAHAHLPDEDSAKAIIDLYQRLGSTQLYMGESTDAHESYQKSLSLALELWQQRPESANRRRLLVTTYQGIGDIQVDDLEPDKALSSLHSALQVFGDEPNGNEDHDHVLMTIHWTIGRALQETGPQQQALEELQRSAGIAEDLARKSPSSPRWRSTLMALYWAMIGPLAGEELLNLGDSKQAEAYARKSLDIAQTEVAADATNDAARTDLVFAYDGIAESLRSSKPDEAVRWYRKSIALTHKLADRDAARNYEGELDDGLADALVHRSKASERLQLLKDNNSIRAELTKNGRNAPRYQMYLMRSYCKLGDAELAAHDVGQARRYADAARPFFDVFRVTSPSLFALRDLGFCFESLGNVGSRIAADRSFAVSDRWAAEADADQWYRKSADVWREFDKRGAATPASQSELRKIKDLLNPTK